MNTRKKILQHARDMYAEHGRENFSMRKLAKTLNISATAIYRHFPDKEHLLLEVCQEGFKLFGMSLMKGLQGRDPLERLTLTGEGYVDFALEHGHYYRVMFMSPHPNFDTLTQESNQAFAPTFQFLIDRISECQRANLIDASLPPEQLAVSIWAHLHGTISLWLDGHLSLMFSSEDDLRAFLKQYTATAIPTTP